MLKGPIHFVFDWEGIVEEEGREVRKPLEYFLPYPEGFLSSWSFTGL